MHVCGGGPLWLCGGDDDAARCVASAAAAAAAGHCLTNVCVFVRACVHARRDVLMAVVAVVVTARRRRVASELSANPRAFYTHALHAQTSQRRVCES